MPDYTDQPLRRPEHERGERDFDKSSLHADQHGKIVHRDYAAHFFRWGFVSRKMKRGDRILDVGCGVEAPLAHVLSGHMSNLPSKYVGVDYNDRPRKGFGAHDGGWREFHYGFNFAEDYEDLGFVPQSFDIATCFEVVEHMQPEACLQLLKGIRYYLKPETGRFYLSTPVFDGHRAAAHIHEYTVEELAVALESTGYVIEARYGTFASLRDVKPQLTPEQSLVWRDLSQYYGNDVLSVMFAPLYPDHSRNNMWELSYKREEAK